MFANSAPNQFLATLKSNLTIARYFHLFFLTLLLMALLASANGQTPGAAVGYLNPQGGAGGGQFKAQCGPTENLMGFETRLGTFIDAIRPICVVSYGATAIGNQVVAPTWNGGPGGHVDRVVCPTSTPVVLGVLLGFSQSMNEDIGSDMVAAIHLYCGQAVPAAQTPAALPSAVLDAQGSALGYGAGNLLNFADSPMACPSGQVAVGVWGRAGKWVDAVGLICGAPRRDTSGKALGRVAATAPAPAMSICDRAKDARARNSPVAAQLEAQCTASQGPPKVLGRTNAPSGSGGGMPVSICDQAQSARARNSPMADQLEARCRAIGGGQGMPPTPDQLAVAGKALSDADPLAAELRKHQPAGPNQRGFDIGMAAAEKDTLWGPGKQKILTSLNAGEQDGFKVAVSYCLDRNKNAQLAAIGSAIAKGDPAVAKARTSDPEVRAWLGFDIASGIFGDPAKGAKHDIAASLQWMAIRESLSLPAQRGFNASRTLHMSRNYKAKI